MLRKWHKKYLIIGLLILFGLVAFSFYSTRGTQKPHLLAKVERGSLVIEVSAAGTLVGQRVVTLTFQTGGRITQVNVKEGDKVYAGQILASLDNSDQAIALQQAQNTLRDKQATLDKVLDDIHLFQYGMGGFGNVGSLNETMTQRQLRTSAEVARDNGVDAVKLAQKAFDDTLIISPLEGIVTEVNSMPGQNASTPDIIIKLVGTSKIYFDAEVDEADIGKISLAQKGFIFLDAYPDRVFEGFIDQIIPQTTTTSSGASIVTVRIKLNEPPQNFINGLSGQATIEIEKAQNTLIIPIEALKEDHTVFIQTSRGPERRTVEIGIQSEAEVEVKVGLSEGDQVILNPLLK